MSQILVSHDGPVTTMQMNRPEKKNALNRSMYDQMARTIDAVSQSNTARVLIISGSEGCFTAGNELSDFADHEQGEHVAETAHFMKSLMECPIPVIARVEGMAVGIGTTMLLHCDFVYCSEDSRFILPFINLALVPEYASSYMLPRLAGHRKASEWLMLGEPILPQEACQFGLVNQICASAELAQKVATTASKLAAKPRAALLHTKALMKTDTQELAIHMNDEMDLFIQALRSDAAQEAFAAFLQKRAVNPEKYK